MTDIQEEMVYKKIPGHRATQIIHFCTVHKIPYDVFNMEDFIMGCNVAELGLRESDWERIGK
jgi:hypothetical protein